MRMLHGSIAEVCIVQLQQMAHVSDNSRTERPHQTSRGLSNMAYVTTTRIAAHSRARRSTGLFGTLKAAFAQRRVYAQTLAELNQLNDRELADLGISRLSIAQVAHEAAYGK
jgi:uncharacterized protein YjiS (DUF1127 family)